MAVQLYNFGDGERLEVRLSSSTQRVILLIPMIIRNMLFKPQNQNLRTDGALAVSLGSSEANQDGKSASITAPNGPSQDSAGQTHRVSLS